MSPHQDIECGIAHSCSCHTSIPPPLLETNEGLKQRRLEQKTVMGEEQEDDSSSLKSTGYVFLLSRGLESTTPTQELSLISLFFIICHFFLLCAVMLNTGPGTFSHALNNNPS